jgi:hypothetical protein
MNVGGGAILRPISKWIIGDIKVKIGNYDSRNQIEIYDKGVSL